LQGQLLVKPEAGTSGGSAQNVNWTSGVGVSISGNNLTRTMAGDSWSAGARSSQSITSGVRQQFTAKERDTETGLDYFGARYYASTQGRFISPDPMLSSGRPIHPQSWNRYSYVMNHPLTLIDPNGLDWGVATWYDKERDKYITHYRYFSGVIGEYNGHTYQAVDFGGDATRTLDLSDGRTVSISIHAEKNGGTFMRDVTIRACGPEQEPVLPPSWMDKVPVLKETRSFLFHFTTHNFEAALLDFGSLSVQLGTATAGASAGAARSFGTNSGEAIFYSNGYEGRCHPGRQKSRRQADF
jgi:RHS repeat-associated protein